MTKRYSVEQVATMLGKDMSSIRQAVEVLREEHRLSAETFLVGDRSWRVTPSDVQKIQAYLEWSIEELPSVTAQRRVRRVIKHKVEQRNDLHRQS